MNFRLVILAGILGLAACSADEPIPLNTPSSGAVVDRGRYVVKSLAACGVCHGEHATPSSVLSGGRSYTDRYGEVRASNLTPAEGALKGWTAEDFLKTFRSSYSKDGRLISREAHRLYEWMSDDDTIAIAAYLQTLPPIRNDIEKRNLSFIDRNTTGFLESDREVRGYVPSVEKRFTKEYGNYLVDNVARCGSCHTRQATLMSSEEYLAGGKTVQGEHGEMVAPGITGSETDGIGSWQDRDIVKYLKTGVTPEGRRVDTSFCPIEFYKTADDGDLEAIATYLKTLPAK